MAARAAIPHLQRNGSGLIINVASAAAFASAPGMVSYNATKAAVLSLSETLAGELRAAGTQVSVVMPTFFETSLLESFRGTEQARAQAHAAHAVFRLFGGGSGARRTHVRGRRPDVHRAARSARLLWRLKRWVPGVFLRQVVRLRERMRAAQ